MATRPETFLSSEEIREEVSGLRDSIIEGLNSNIVGLRSSSIRRIARITSASYLRELKKINESDFEASYLEDEY